MHFVQFILYLFDLLFCQVVGPFLPVVLEVDGLLLQTLQTCHFLADILVLMDLRFRFLEEFNLLSLRHHLTQLLCLIYDFIFAIHPASTFISNCSVHETRARAFSLINSPIQYICFQPIFQSYFTGNPYLASVVSNGVIIWPSWNDMKMHAPMNSNR